MAFYEFEITIQNQDKKELGINTDDLNVNIMMDLAQVESFYAARDEDDDLVWTVVYMRSGESFTIHTDYSKFKSIHKTHSGQTFNLA